MPAELLPEVYMVPRASMQDVLKSDNVTLATTGGLKERFIARRYVLRNSLLPLVSLISFSMASIISRVVLVEAVFEYNGVGDLFVDAVVNRDYPVLEGTLFLFTLIVIVGGLIGDFALVRFDPRLRR